MLFGAPAGTGGHGSAIDRARAGVPELVQSMK